MNIIIASVSGGIGNQLFQYAHARNIALNSKTIIIIDASWFTSIPDALTKRSFNLSALVDNLHVIDSKNISRSVRYGLKFLGQVINLIFKKNIYAEITEFKAFAHQRVDLKKITYLNGYWQNLSYIYEAIPLVIEDIIASAGAKKYTSMVMCNLDCRSLGIHIRRGDYVLSSALKPVEIEYIYSALKLARKLGFDCADLTLYISSDDVEWCKSSLDLTLRKMGYNFIYTKDLYDNDDLFDFFLLSNCDCLITSNSTFSWWSAMIASVKNNATIICPSEWLTGVGIDAINLLPKDWHTVA